MFFWIPSNENDVYSSYSLEEDDPEYQVVDEDQLVYLKGDPDQILYAFKDVLNGSEVIFPDEKTSEVLPSSSSAPVSANDSTSNLQFSLPPRLAEKTLLLILSKTERETLIGDLAEEWLEIQSVHGRGFANVWYWEQTVLSLWPLVRKALRWTVAAGFGEWLRRQIF